MPGEDGDACCRTCETGRAADRRRRRRRRRARCCGAAGAVKRRRAPTATATPGRATCAPATSGATVRVAGWVHRRRDHGGLIFIDLRDRSGIVQLVFHPDATRRSTPPSALRPEHVLTAPRRGRRAARRATSTRTSRPARSSSHVAELEQLADAETPPFPIDEDGRGRRDAAPAAPLARPAPRARCSDAMVLRHAVVKTMRDELDDARLPRDRDADPHALDARGRARLPRARRACSRARSTRCRSRRSCSSSC